MLPDSTTAKPTRLSLACPWLKRVGVVGFLFFLIKGLMWLLLPGLLAYFGFNN
jgi:hypothetical protein